MNASQLSICIGARMRRPGAWGAVFVFAFLWNSLRWMVGPTHFPVGEFLLPFLLGALVLVVAAVPWQWTGDERFVTPLGRGLAQALPVNALLMMLLLPLLAEHGGHGGRNRIELPFLPELPPRLMVILTASGAFSLLAGWILADRDQEALKGDIQGKLAREAQALALQAQMNPHVLFNVLGGLAELARENGAAAEAALVDLAGLLRRLMAHASRSVAPLDEERALVEGFLSLERFRLGDRLEVQWSWDPRLEDLEVPPMLLQPLVENAIKHGIVPNRDGGAMKIGLGGERNRVRLWVANSGIPLDASEGKGMGLRNLRERLALMDGWRGRLDLRSEDGWTIAELFLESSRG